MWELMSLQKKSEEEINKELEDYRRFVYYELDTLPNLSERKEASSLKSLKSPIVTELQIVQPKSKATELPQDQTESDGPKSQTMKLEPNEISETHPKSKELMLERYVRRHHASN